MYQDVRFWNKEERRQFVISSVSERDWKREHRLELLIVSIFQMQVKFSKVCSPFCSTAGTVSKKIPMGDTQNFLQDVKRNINALCVICGWCMVELRSRPMRISLLGAIDAGNELQITITCKTKQWLSLSRQYRRVEYSWSTTTQNSQLFTLERSGNAENPAHRAGYVNGRTFPRVAGDGWRVTGSGWRVRGSGWNVRVRVQRISFFIFYGLTHHPPPATRHPLPATRHPPSATRHPPPVIRHPSSAEKSCRVRKCWKA